jgi:hypothetical protein
MTCSPEGSWRRDARGGVRHSAVISDCAVSCGSDGKTPEDFESPFAAVLIPGMFE